MTAGKTCRIASSQFLSIVVHQDRVYAAPWSKNQTDVFQHNTTPQTGWRQQRSINHDTDMKNAFEETECLNTISISNNQLKCCSIKDNIIKVYSLSGELLQIHGTFGSGDAGQFHNPAICDDDDDSSVLIADFYNARLQVMSEKGEFSVLQLQPPVSLPCSAALFNNQLYVTSPNDRLISKYSC